MRELDCNCQRASSAVRHNGAQRTSQPAAPGVLRAPRVSVSSLGALELGEPPLKQHLSSQLLPIAGCMVLRGAASDQCSASTDAFPVCVNTYIGLVPGTVTLIHGCSVALRRTLLRVTALRAQAVGKAVAWWMIASWWCWGCRGSPTRRRSASTSPSLGRCRRGPCCARRYPATATLAVAGGSCASQSSTISTSS